MKIFITLCLLSFNLHAIGVGQSVQINQKSCTVGQEIGRGAYGKVHELPNCPEYVLKDYLDKRDVVEKIKEEVWVHEVLSHYKINTVEAFHRQINNDHFQIKTRIVGKTIGDIISGGLLTKNSIYEKTLFPLIQQIMASGLLVTELNQLNVMFDEVKKRWVVVDAAFYKTPVGTSPNVMPWIKPEDSSKLILFNAYIWGEIAGMKKNPTALNNFNRFQEDVLKELKEKILNFSNTLRKDPPPGRAITQLPRYIR
ncbi:MAG: hypothetical protein OEY33_00920 [Bdellovibrionales bacterium]|nr:hypothetical protein [Bdellovibrionales bacterium]